MAGTISEKLRFLIEADASGAIRGFEQTGKAADRELGRAQTKIDATGAKLTSFGAKAVAAGGVAGAALFGAAKSFEGLAIEAGRFSDATGLAVEDASRWIEVAGDMGVEAGAVESALGKFNKTIAASPDKVAALGVELVRTKDGVVDVNATFLSAIDTINAIPDPTKRAAAAAALFGKGWQGMAELIASGSDSLRTSLAAVSDAKVINADELARAKAFREAMDALADAGQDLAISIGQGAAPVIGTLATTVGEAVGAVARFNTATDGAVGQVAAVGAAAVTAAGGVAFVSGKVIQLRDSLKAMSATAGLAAGALSLGVLALVNYADKKAKAKQRTDEFVAALRAEVQGQKDAVNARIAAMLATEQIQKLMGATGLTMRDLAAAVRGEASAFDDLAGRLKVAGGSSAGAVREQQRLKDEFGLSYSQLIQYASGVDDAIKAHADAEVIFNRTADAEKALGVATEGTTNAIEGQVEAAKQLPTMSSGTWMIQTNLANTEAGLKRVEDAIKRLRGELDIESAFDNLDDTLDDVEAKAKAAFDAAVKGAEDADAKMEEYTDGIRDARGAILNTIETMGGLSEPQIAHVEALMDMGKFREAEAFLAALERNRTATITPVIGKPVGSIPGAVYDNKGNIVGFGGGGGKSGGKSAGGSGRVKYPDAKAAEGGIATRPTVTLIGEAGRPEAVVPLSRAPGGMALPAAGLAAPANVTINVNAGLGADGASIGQAVVQAIRDYERRNGRVFAAA